MRNPKTKFFIRLIVLQAVIIAFVILFVPHFASAISPKQAVEPDPSFYSVALIAIALSISIPSLGAGLVLKSAIPAAISALTERPTVGGLALIFVALGEAIAIYGLIIAIMLMQYLPVL